MRVAFPLPARTSVDGDTAFAAESPEFVTVSVTWNDSPTLTGADGTVNAADNAAGVWTTTLTAVGVEADTV